MRRVEAQARAATATAIRRVKRSRLAGHVLVSWADNLGCTIDIGLPPMPSGRFGRAQ